MSRIAGFLTGSAAAIALILLVIGLPELGAPAAPLAEPAVAAASDPTAEPTPAPLPEPVLESEPVPEPQPEPQPEPVVATPPPQPPGLEPAAAAQWHAFWSPFGSRIAADGFVRRLESVTGFDYRVVKIDDGVYEVAFAYDDEPDRDAMLATIAAATGLELPDS